MQGGMVLIPLGVGALGFKRGRHGLLSVPLCMTVGTTRPYI